MLTVTQLARACGLSRSTVLYYESIGLLAADGRSAGNYRKYGEAAARRLRQICAYRNAGLTLADIGAVLDRPASNAARVLERRLAEIGEEIERLRGHQRAILRLLQFKPSIGRTSVLTKDKLVAIMKGAGFSEADMHRWHAEFEKQAPQEHQEFLEFLHIAPEEVRQIRDWSRKGAAKS